jgi:hypothetical protein
MEKKGFPKRGTDTNSTTAAMRIIFPNGDMIMA